MNDWILELSHQALEEAPVIAAVFNPAGELVIANRAFREAAGGGDHEKLSGTCYSALGLESPCPVCPVREVIRTEAPYESGLTPFWHCKASPLMHNGVLVGVVSILSDVSTLSRTANELTRSTEALNERTRQLKLLFHEMQDGFALHEMILDAQGIPVDYRFLEVNPAFGILTGLSSDAIVGKTAREVLPGIESSWIEQYGKVVLTGEPVFFENHSAVLGRYYEVKAFRNEPGQFVTLFSDVTERKRAAAERESLREQLAQSQKLESIGRLAGGVAHDFNNMLNIILSNAEMLIDDVPLFSQLHDSLTQIQNAAKRSATLTAQLLAFARKQPMAPKKLDLNAQVESLLKMLRRLIGEELELVWKPGPDAGFILFDPSQLDQVLTNLCVNARDAIENHGTITIETGQVELSETDCSEIPDGVPGTFVMLKVSDTGRGMDEETRSHLFEPFFTTKALGKGTGLGLATVHGIISQNNGFVCVRSSPGKGTTFRVFLPRQDTKPSCSSPGTGAIQDIFGSETILLVEDEPEILHVARRILERHGYRVLIALTPTAALELAENHGTEICLLVSDVVMPEMNGRDLARELIARIPHLKCLFMSGYTADYISRHGVLDDGVHFIQKPFTKQEFTLKVRQVLDAEH